MKRSTRVAALPVIGMVLSLLSAGHSTAGSMACPRLSSADLEHTVSAASARSGVPPTWLEAVINHESARYPCAVSVKGAMGLMQLMPATWATFRERLGLGPSPFDVADNVLAGATYLRELYDRFGPVGMLAAYSAGAGRYIEARSSGRPLPSETTAYIAALAPRLQVGGAPTAKPPVASYSVFAQISPRQRDTVHAAGAAADPGAADLFVAVAMGDAP
ncbi:lytic transglycosylase domain-containing protein [Caulobacter sp. KR2-114]|uniref:lytic transglycosylase domain-containing protein n=1 Tax=Caulobacter sp. KR2-114 TaxID=3400912 RepID=UPI003C0145EA